jgi:hypothetical protein
MVEQSAQVVPALVHLGVMPTVPLWQTSAGGVSAERKGGIDDFVPIRLRVAF